MPDKKRTVILFGSGAIKKWGGQLVFGAGLKRYHLPV